MTEVAVAGDELRCGHPRQAPGIADSGDELQRGVRHGRRRTWPRRRARHGERRWRTRPPATWSSDCHLELQHCRPPSTAPPLTPTSGSIRVAGRCALRRRPNSIAGPLRSASLPTVDPTASPGFHPIHLLLQGSKETRWDAKNLLTWLWLAVECGRIIFYVISHIMILLRDPLRISFVEPDDTRHDRDEDYDTS
ncbi:Os10g0333100 [Oryza sativa Japonica Group]|uniref:Os10g0333100 protein n=1 Tax=Oryza sativa subsp. japonica TaxID=39947 RepID=A0A0P0XSZ6_ORYSJ|nr:Os10g0333100 [Oryza sativa Japonica Group]